jgi:hypothetical protein
MLQAVVGGVRIPEMWALGMSLHRQYKILFQKEVNCRIGFCDLRLLLSFVSVVCDGDLITMTCTSSMLTWLEKWILCCEFAWGWTLLRYKDFSKEYCGREPTLQNVNNTKLGLIRAVRDWWPMYASFVEDTKFCGIQWNEHFDPTNDHCDVMHNSTNMPLSQSIDTALQHALYSSYYDMCCAKAGVVVQLSGCLHGLPLNTGHRNDTPFINNTEIFAKAETICREQQEQYKAIS